MPTVMGPTRKRVLDEIAAQGLEPAGPWFTHHLRPPSETLEFEICVPTTLPIRSSGDVYPNVRRELRVARTVYAGGYEGLGDAWGNFIEWIEQNKLKVSGELWECYLTSEGDDSAAYRTELCKEILE